MNAVSKTFKCTFILMTALLSADAQVDSATGGASGVVLDAKGKPLAGATVFLEGALHSPSAVTDSEGRFLIRGFSGDWGLSAYKEADGYPYNFAAFLHTPGEQFPYIHVVPGQVTGNVVIQLGPKPATIRFDVKDEHGRLLSARAVFSRPDMPQISDYIEIVSNNSVLVPAVPLRLVVQAEGYEDWHFGGAGWKTPNSLIRLKPAETLTLPIQLQRRRKAD
jgi:hypothetical protein